MAPPSAKPEQAPVAKAKADESPVKAADENVASKPKAKVENANDPESRSKKKTNLAPSESRSGSATSGTPGAHRITGMGSGSEESLETSDQSQTIDDTIEQSVEITAPTINTHELTDTDAEGTNGSASSPQVTTAYLVREKVVAEVEPIKPFYQRKEGKRTILVVALLIVGMAVLLGVLLDQDAQQTEELMPTMAPTQSPTFDPRPTLEVVQDRGVLNCGLEDFVTEGAENFGQYNEDFCRGLAAVVFGDPEKFEPVYVGDDRYDKLLGREVDVLYAGDTFTLAKSIKEETTGTGLAFGFPYYGAAVVYAGNATYVQCATTQKRFDECEDLSICAVDTAELLSLLPQYFPASFITFGPFPLMEEYLLEGKCNVIVSDTYRLAGSILQEYINNQVYVISDYYISRNLLSSVVRYGDPQWFDIVEASRLTRFRATQIGLYQNETLCYEEIPEELSLDVSFYKSPICVGNSVQTFQRSLGSLVIGFGTKIPAIDGPTLGSLECSDCEDVLQQGKLREIRERGQLNCAVYLDPAHNLTRSSLATLVNDKFCEMMGVAIFHGDPGATNITYIDSFDYSYFPTEFDIVAGVGWEGKTGNSWDDTNAGSMSMSYPYFVHDKYRHFGKVYDGIGFHLSFATDNNDHWLNMVATTVIVATIFAQREGITKATYTDMPLIHLFGNSLTFMLRDVIAHGGNYDEVLQEAFVNSDQTTEIGWNMVISMYGVAAQSPVLYCDLTGNCPPCEWFSVQGFPVCVSFGPY